LRRVSAAVRSAICVAHTAFSHLDETDKAHDEDACVTLNYYNSCDKYG